MNTAVAGSLPDASPAWIWRHGHTPLQLVRASLRLAAPAPGEVLVHNRAIGLNPVDWKLIQHAPGNWTPGHVPGVDGAGVIIAIGDGVDQRWLGRRVAYHGDLARQGSFAHHVQLPARCLLPIPDAMDFEVAAGVPCPALTAWMALDKLPARDGAALLVSGAGGAVGTFAVQLAVARGFKVSVLCHPRHWSRLRLLGAIETFDNTRPMPTTVAGRFFAVLDSIGPERAQALADTLAASGHLVCIQGRVTDWPCSPVGRTLSLHEVALGALHQHGDDAAWARVTTAGEQLLRLISAGHLKTDPLVIRGFDELPRHLQALRDRDFSGKPVVRIDAS